MALDTKAAGGMSMKMEMTVIIGFTGNARNADTETIMAIGLNNK